MIWIVWFFKSFICILKIFSIIIFDRVNSKIFFFKDPVGQKPLYYSFINEDLVVSSEIKDIVYLLKKRNKKIKENKKVVFKYLLRGWCNDSKDTFFRDIFEFPAGTYSIYSKKNYQNLLSIGI